MTVTGISEDAGGTSVTIGVPTSGRIPNGATVERLVETPVRYLGIYRAECKGQ